MSDSWTEKLISDCKKRIRKKDRNKKSKRTRRGTPFCNRRVGVPDYGRQDLLAWGRRVGVRTVKEFQVLIKGDANAPGFHHILREFGSWRNYRDQLNLPKLVDPLTEFDLSGYVRLCVGYSCTGFKRDYEYRRSRYGEFLLSPYKILKYYGSWYNFRRLIRNFNMELLIEDYVVASLRVGHSLSTSECFSRGIDISRARHFFGRKLFSMLVRKKEELVLGGEVVTGTKYIGSNAYEERE